MSRLDALAIGKAYYARLYLYSRLRKREPLIAQKLSHQMVGGLNFCVCRKMKLNESERQKLDR